jgi:hypothetical protein
LWKWCAAIGALHLHSSFHNKASFASRHVTIVKGIQIQKKIE